MESHIARLSSKGQLTLPASVRRKPGLKKGARLFLAVERNEIRIRELKEDRPPVFTKESSFFRLIGSFAGPEDLAEKHNEYPTEEKR